MYKNDNINTLFFHTLVCAAADEKLSTPHHLAEDDGQDDGKGMDGRMRERARMVRSHHGKSLAHVL